MTNVNDSIPSIRSPQTPYARLSAVEIAARRGFGPLSSSGGEVWHGNARPCVSCGELVRRGEATCANCGQTLTMEMLQKMAAYAGPWYVHEHVRPFPGVTLERLVRQARRGVLTTTTIVRGPSTHQQWRFAAETPGLAHHLGVCWQCQASVTDQTYACQQCGAVQQVEDDAGTPASAPPAFAPAAATSLAALTGSPLDALNQAVHEVPSRPDPGAVASGFRVPMPLIIFVLVTVTIASLIYFVQKREAELEMQRGAAKTTGAARAVVKPPAIVDEPILPSPYATTMQEPVATASVLPAEPGADSANEVTSLDLPAVAPDAADAAHSADPEPTGDPEPPGNPGPAGDPVPTDDPGPGDTGASAGTSP